MCRVGFHFCREPVECLAFYQLNSGVCVAKVTAVGETEELKSMPGAIDSSKLVTSALRIDEEMKMEDFKKLCNGTVFDAGNFDKCTYVEGELHSEGDVPAVVSQDGSRKEWHSRGQCYRAYGPRKIYTTPYCLDAEWMQKPNNYHRENGPSVIYINSVRAELQYWKDGRIHNPRGPARIVWEAGTNEDDHFYEDRREHFLDGSLCVKSCVGEEDPSSEFNTERFTKLLNEAVESKEGFIEAMRKHFKRWTDPAQDRPTALVPIQVEEEKKSDSGQVTDTAPISTV